MSCRTAPLDHVKLDTVKIVPAIRGVAAGITTAGTDATNARPAASSGEVEITATASAALVADAAITAVPSAIVAAAPSVRTNGPAVVPKGTVSKRC